MKKTYFTVVVMALVLLVSSCGTSIKVTSDYNGKAAFGSYMTFNFKKSDSAMSDYPALINPINQQRLENAISDQMSLRKYASSDAPDLWISYYVKITEKTEYQATTSYPYYGGWGYYGHYYGYGHGWTTVQSYDYNVGTLVIDIVDARTNELVWYGVGTKVLKENNNDPEGSINYAVSQIFNHYPFLAGQQEPVKTTSAPRGQTR
jgi:hypothetical protein